MSLGVATSLPRHAAPPGFLRLAGHPLRWTLLSELVRSDRQVHELSALLGRPQSLVSYHLARLRAGQLVSMRRSSADRRDAYYTVDLARCGELLAAAGAALHPGLRLALAPYAGPQPPLPSPPSSASPRASGTPRAHRSPRRCSATWAAAGSKREARAATPRACTRTRYG